MNRTDFLFAQPSFVRGMGRVLDLGSTRNIYNESDAEVDADRKALQSDWNVVGDDVMKAINTYRELYRVKKLDGKI